MSKVETFVCYNGTNTSGVDVEFQEGETEILRETPCPSCIWRYLIDFQQQPEFEQFIDLREASEKRVEAYVSYNEARRKAEQEALAGGGIFEWESLKIVRYTGNKNQIGCWTQHK